MIGQQTVAVYFDYKSPYAYLAKDLVYNLEREFPVRVDWLPYTLDIPSFLGSARVDENGRVIEAERNAHQWRRVRYSYMDCRRQARKRGLVIRGPQKIWDSTIASCGMLYSKQRDEAVMRRYHDIVFERFWKRELNIEDIDVISAVRPKPARCRGLPHLSSRRGPAGARRHLSRCRSGGVFGVPSFVVDGELFWGREHLPDIREILNAACRRASPDEQSPSP